MSHQRKGRPVDTVLMRDQHRSNCNPAKILMGNHYASGGAIPLTGEAKANPMRTGGRAGGGQMNMEDRLKADYPRSGRTEMEREDRSRGSAFKHGGHAKHRAEGGSMAQTGVNTGSSTAREPGDSGANMFKKGGHTHRRRFALGGAGKARKNYPFT